MPGLTLAHHIGNVIQQINVCTSFTMLGKLFFMFKDLLLRSIFSNDFGNIEKEGNSVYIIDRLLDTLIQLKLTFNCRCQHNFSVKLDFCISWITCIILKSKNRGDPRVFLRYSFYRIVHTTFFSWTCHGTVNTPCSLGHWQRGNRSNKTDSF